MNELTIPVILPNVVNDIAQGGMFRTSLDPGEDCFMRTSELESGGAVCVSFLSGEISAIPGNTTCYPVWEVTITGDIPSVPHP